MKRVKSTVLILGTMLFIASAGFASEHAEGEADGGLDVMHHVLDSHEIEIPFYDEPIHLPHWEIAGFDISPTKHIVMMWIVAALLLVVGISMSIVYRNGRKVDKAPTGLANLVEVLVDFVRSDIAKIYIGKKGDPFLPYLVSVFFFVLGCNVFGLIPGTATATGNIAVTMTLACITFLITQFSAIKTHGLKGWLAHFTGGTPIGLWPVMIPVEIIGLFVKPFALMVRLFANMTAGHIAIGTLIGLIFIFKSWAAVPVSVALTLAIYALEVFVSLVQAYVFTLLSALFIGMAVETHHDEHAH